MRAVVQRVARASVEIDGQTAGEIDGGLLVFLGVGRDDTGAATSDAKAPAPPADGRGSADASLPGAIRGPADAAMLAEKVANLRIFPDADGKSNLSLLDTGGAALVISQFTLYADCRRGRRPSFTDAADPEPAEALVEKFRLALERLGVLTAAGRFGEHMVVSLVNDGPYTILLDTETLAGPRRRRSDSQDGRDDAREG
ncbi:MAG: D-aminoacyl-tRNA deacylase [bacterium]